MSRHRRIYYAAEGNRKQLDIQVVMPDGYNTVMLCGYSVKESLKRAIFFIDRNATIAKGVPYQPPTLNVEKVRGKARKS